MPKIIIDKGLVRMLIFTLIFVLCVHSAFEYHSILAGIGAVISFFGIMIQD